MASSTKRQATASDGKLGDAKHSALQNGTSERSRDADKESRKEWMYEEKVGKCMRACISTMKHLLLAATLQWRSWEREGAVMLADWFLQGKTQGPVSKKRLLEKWQKFKTEGKSKVSLVSRFCLACISLVVLCLPCQASAAEATPAVTGLATGVMCNLS